MNCYKGDRKRNSKMLESAFEIDDNIAIYDGYTDGTH
jgi:hypothetical protein